MKIYLASTSPEENEQEYELTRRLLSYFHICSNSFYSKTVFKRVSNIKGEQSEQIGTAKGITNSQTRARGPGND